jgi:hypothetical protein
MTEIVTGLRIDLDHFRARILQDALTEATAQYWVHRAYQFQQAAPRPTDYRGNATPEQLTEAWVQCLITAAACRRHAELITGEYPEPISAEVLAVLGEVA